ncbi:MAG: hypothetical protein PVF56_23725 [Desulfobacterales bacterium]|jgi:hypothetical protein
MGFGNKVWAIFKTGVCVILLGSLVACQGGIGSYAGKTVDAKDRIELLEGGPHRGSWETRDLLVEFQYSREPQDLKISGLIKLQEYLRNIYWLKNLYLRLHFVDAGGKVMADQALLKSVSNLKRVPSEVPFQVELKIPGDAAAIAFIYRGWAKAGPRSEDWEFWKLP